MWNIEASDTNFQARENECFMSSVSCICVQLKCQFTPWILNIRVWKKSTIKFTFLLSYWALGFWGQQGIQPWINPLVEWCDVASDIPMRAARPFEHAGHQRWVLPRRSWKQWLPQGFILGRPTDSSAKFKRILSYASLLLFSHLKFFLNLFLFFWGGGH